MEEYKDLIDLALKLGDKEWFNHLTEQSKQYEKIKPIDNVQNQSINKKNIALEEFNNNGIALQSDEGLRTPNTYEDLEKYKFVKIKSKRNEALKILKGEEVDVEQLPLEESQYYKIYYYGFLQGFCICYNTVAEKNKTIEKLESELELQKVLHNILKGISSENAELLKLLNNKKKISLWNKIKAVFKNNGVKST